MIHCFIFQMHKCVGMGGTPLDLGLVEPEEAAWPTIGLLFQDLLQRMEAEIQTMTQNDIA